MKTKTSRTQRPAHFLAAATLSAGIALAAGGAGADTLYGVTGDGATDPEALYILNTSDASATRVNGLGDGDDGESIAYRDVDGLLYHWSGLSSFRFMQTVDPGTGNVIADIEQSGDDPAEIFGSTYDSDNDIFYTTDRSRNLVTVTPGGVWNTVGDLDLNDDCPTGCRGITFDSSGNLWVGQRGEPKLLRVDPATATVLDTVTVTFGGVNVAGFNGLATEPSTGKIFGLITEPGTSDRRLMTIDTATGVATDIGALSDKFANIAFVPSEFFKVITDGPDVDEDGVIDVVVATSMDEPEDAAYQFTITYPTDPDETEVAILDTVPAEWQVVNVSGNDDPIDGDYCWYDVSDGNPEPGTVDVAPGSGKCNRQKSATHIDWRPDSDNDVSTLDIGVETRLSPSGKSKSKPATCGPLYLNNGAIAVTIEEDAGLLINSLLLDPSDIVAGPTDPLCLVAVDDPESTLTNAEDSRSAEADHDGDGVASYAESCENTIRTDPCLGDTDGDTINDDADNCPLVVNADQTDVDNDNVGAACDADDGDDQVGIAQCADGKDNDGDDQTDHATSIGSPDDPDSDCTSATDDDESA